MIQLLWIETLLKLAGGVALMVAPGIIIRVLGLPPAGSGFWPRLLGGMLVGLAAATFMEGTIVGAHGLGLAGCVVINLTGAGVVGAIAMLGAGAQTRRGVIVLWLLVAVLVVLSLVEIAHV